MLTNFSANEDFFAVFRTRLTNVLLDARANIKQQTWTVGPFQGAYLFRLYVCDKEMSWPNHIGETHQPDWVVYVRDRNQGEITFRLTNAIPERIIFFSRGITVFIHFGQWHVTQQTHRKHCLLSIATMVTRKWPVLTLCYSRNAHQWFFNTITLSNQK
jgi:hypothetical protein